MREPAVFIAGYGAVSAVGSGIGSLAEALQNNRTGLRPLPKFDSPRFQSKLVGLAPRDLESEDPAWELATAALKEAGKTVAAAGRMGLILSTTKANITALERLMDARECSGAARRHLRPEWLAADLAAAFNLRGPVQTVSVACVSGLTAIQQGVRLIQRGEADEMYVVGVDCISEFVMAGFTALKALDPAGCRPFDAHRCGLSAGEAGAAIRLTKAAPPGAARMAGFGSSNDANHLTGPSRDGSGLAQAIRAALKASGLDAAQIDYIHAHGTGTNYNDAMESLALASIFGENCPPVSGSKGMLGHTLGAAGVLETICCVLAMEQHFIPGTPGLSVAAAGMPKSLAHTPRHGVKLKNVLKLNTGFGGMNGALILQSA